MGNAVRQLCALSILCGVLMQLIPEGGVKRVAAVLCTAAILSSACSAAGGFDWTEYAKQNASFQQRQQQLFQSAEEARARLSRFVIEEKYETYIMDKASTHDISLTSVKVKLHWATEGFWYPGGVSLEGRWSEQDRSILSALLTRELGIPASEQEWKTNDQLEREAAGP